MRQFALSNIFQSRQAERSSIARVLSFAAWSCMALLVIAIMTPLGANAQMAGYGAISGTVTDSTGAVVGGATVTATLVDQNVNTVRTTSGAGDYTITPLTPGEYNLTVTAKGFEKFIQQHITVDALVTVGVNVNLSVGAATQTITVTTAPPILETTDASLGAVMDNEMYASLPLLMGAGGNNDQRRATDFAALMPGVVPAWVGSNNATDASLSVNGGNPAGGTSEIYIDGINLPAPDGVGDVRFIWSAIGMDSIDQFQVQTSGFSAQYAGQGVQNYSIKQGSNEWHGGVYEYIRNTVGDAWRFFSKAPAPLGPIPSGGSCAFGSPATSYCAPGGIKPAEIMNEVGAKFGGPIVKNKLFVFYNYGQYRNQNGPSNRPQTIPTTAMLNGDFSAFSTITGYQIWDPGSQTPGCLGSVASPCSRAQFVSNGSAGQPAAGTLNVIPTARLSAAAKYINTFMAPYEASAIQGGSAAGYSNNVVAGYVNGLANWYQGGRIDYNMSEKNQLSLIVEFGRQANTGPNAPPSTTSNQLAPPFNTVQAYTPKTTVDIVKDTFTINSHMVNMASIAYARYKSLSTTPDDGPQFTVGSNFPLLNTPAGQASAFPGITYSGGLDDPQTEAGYDENQKVSNSYSAADDFQWQLGKHSFTFGGQVVWDQFNLIKNLTNSGPLAVTFSNASTGGWTGGTSLNSSSGNAFASYMLGAINSSSVSVGLPGYGSTWIDPSFWAQDDWKISPKLTVNLGVRWDIWPALHATHSIMSWLNTTQVNSVTGNLGTLGFAGGSSSDGYHTGMFNPSPTTYKNIGPRLGLAYALNSKTVIRSSYGLEFARGDWNSGSQSGSASTVGFAPSASAPAGTINQPSYYWDATQCTGTGAGNADSVPCGWTGSVANPAPPAGGLTLAEFGTSETTLLTNAGAQSPVYWDPHYGAKTPEYLNWTFGVERQLTNNMSISVSYVGSEGHFISDANAIGKRNNEIPESFAALAGYVVSGTTAVACTGFCSGALLGQASGTSATAPMVNTNLAIGLGFTPPNPYVGNTYYFKNNVSSYMTNYPQFSGVSDTTSFVGNENWNALEITLRQRPAHGLNFMVNYTYSKSIDDLGTFRVGDNDHLDRSLSTADIPQNVVASVVYALPTGRGHMWGDNLVYRAIASDWTASTIFSYHSGFPIALTGSTGCGGASILKQCMPSIVSGQPGRVNGAYGKNTTSAPGSPNYIGGIQYFNYLAFDVATVGTAANYGTCTNTSSSQVCNVGNGPALYVPGNAPRVAALNMFGMGYYDDDIAVKRTFPVYHEWNVAIEVDMSNLTNHVVWASPNSAVNGGSSFGTISALNAGNAPRDLQGMLRINF
jgi:hypothetical protein